MQTVILNTWDFDHFSKPGPDKWTTSSLLKMMIRNTKTEFRILGPEEYWLGNRETWTADYWKQIDSYLTKNKNTLDILVNSDDYHDEPLSPQVKVHCWPTFWVSQAYYEYTRPDREERHAHNKRVLDQQVTVPFINMNNGAWKHRCYMVDELARLGILDCGDVSWNRLTDSYLWQHWTERIINIDDFYTQAHRDFWRCPYVYGRSFIDLVSETSMGMKFLTEKTCRPLYFKKPFIVFSSPGYYRYLKKLGFELYDEIIDYSFDREDEPWIRGTMVAEEVKKVSSGIYPGMRNRIADKLEYNHRRFCEVATDRTLIPDVALKEPRYETLLSYLLPKSI